LVLFGGLLLSSSAVVAQQQNATTKKDGQIIIGISGELTNQTAPIQGLTLFVPEVTGIYRITSYTELTEISSMSSYACPSLSWSDDSKFTQTAWFTSFTQQGETNCANNQPDPSPSNISLWGIIVVRALANTPAILSVDQAGTAPYSIYLTVERVSPPVAVGNVSLGF
jgi:hypothetical protein